MNFAGKIYCLDFFAYFVTSGLQMFNKNITSYVQFAYYVNVIYSLFTDKNILFTYNVKKKKFPVNMSTDLLG